MEHTKDILEQLARGEISAELAEEQLAELDRAAPEAPPPITAASNSPATESRESHAASLPRVRAELSGGGRIEVRGDETVTTPLVEGPASATVTPGDPTEVAGNIEDEALVRVPAEVDLELTVNAGDAKLHGVRGRLDATFNVGDADVDCTLTNGASRILANCGTLKITFSAGSAVTVMQRCAGDLQADSGFRKSGRGQWTLGAGIARLEIDGNLGSIVLSSQTGADDQL